MSEVVLLAPAVENLILVVQVRHEQKVSRVARVFLRKAGEENAERVLSEIESAELGTVRCVSALIVYKVKKRLACSGSPSENSASPLQPRELVDEENLMANSSCGPPTSDEFSEATLLEIERIMKGCEPGMSDGLSDAALLALPLVNTTTRPCIINDALSDDALLRIDIPGGAGSPFVRCEQRESSTVGECRSYGFSPTSALPLVASQGSNDSVNAGPLLVCSWEPECTPSSHSSEPIVSSPMKRSSGGSFDDGSARSVKAKHGKQKSLPGYFKQAKPFLDPQSCPVPVTNKMWGGADQFADGRKLEFGDARKLDVGDALKLEFADGRKLEFGDARKLDVGDALKLEFADGRKLEFGDARKLDVADGRNLNFGNARKLEFGDARNLEFADARNLEFGDARKMDFADGRNLDFGDARKLDFGDEPFDPRSASGLVPKSEPEPEPEPQLLQENVQPKECVFRHKECAHHRSDFPDLEKARVYGELSFSKRFLVLDHCKDGQAFPSLSELEIFKRLDAQLVDNRLFHTFTHPDHISMRDWSKLGKAHPVYTCNVSHAGKCEFMGPRFENGGTPLQRAFGEDNVLVVKFEDTTKNNHTILDRYRCLARHGIHCGLKRFYFYAFKDAESKKKQGVSKKNTYGCKAFFVAIASTAAYDSPDIVRRFESIAKARNYVMHPTVSTLAKAISRLQLALSQTTQIPLDFEKVRIVPVKDIACKDEKGNEVRDANGKLLIHTDGCGSISKNLAMLCQQEVVKGIEQTDSKDKQEYPLMMQVRLFYLGNLWKGVLVVDLKLPENTIEVRPSMLKVERDEKLSSDSFNSLELCNTSRKPADARLFQHLILLLTMGGVKEGILLKHVEACMEKLRGYLTSTKEALRVAVRSYDCHHSAPLACEMLLSGMDPSQEPFLQKVISEMIKYEIKSYSVGKVPVRDTAYLMGCADPTGLLERNQVVILVGNGARICRERVLVYKPPGLHAGDVHVFEATWVKQIEAHVGTGTYGIIFSTKGARSVTDEMAGSDLDGDQYWVSWNPELVDSFTPSPPWEAPNVIDEKKPLPRPPTDDEFETLHFEKFLQTKFDPSMIKGRAANSWLALTDYTMSVPGDSRVEEHISTLVNLFYESLDAEKSGKEIRWPSHINITRFPHYLEKNKDDGSQDSGKPRSASNRLLAASSRKPAKSFEEYQSKSILGKIYDSVKREDLDKPVNVDVDKVYEYEGYLDYYDMWQQHVNEYGRRTNSVLNAIKLGSFVDQEFRNCAYDKLLAEYKKKFVGESGKKPQEQLLKEASAIYTAVYSKAVIKESLTLQFAWKIAGSQLCKIRAEKQGGGHICMSSDMLDFLLRR